MRYYKRLNPDNTTNTVESYSHTKKVAGAIAISKTEFDAFIASLPIIEPEPDPSVKIAELEARIVALEK